MLTISLSELMLMNRVLQEQKAGPSNMENDHSNNGRKSSLDKKFMRFFFAFFLAAFILPWLIAFFYGLLTG